jgi:hypothetical protein
MEFLIYIIIIGIAWYFLTDLYLKKKSDKLAKKHIHPDYPNFSYTELQDIPIAGVHHYKYGKALKTGDKLLMIRDPNNDYDLDAIKFTTLFGKQVGHVPSDRNEKFAEAMDNGQKFFAVTKKVSKKGDYIDVVATVSKVDE